MTEGVIEFAVGETQKELSIALANDDLYEGVETFNLKLHNPSPGTTIQTPEVEGQIHENSLQ